MRFPIQARATEPAPEREITISAATVGATLMTAIALLLLAHLVCQIAYFGFGHGALFGLTRLFDLDTEANVPTWYSASALLICGLTLGLIAAAKRQVDDPYTRY